MILKGIIFEDIVNYKKTSMTLMAPTCSFKCGKEICQNNPLVNEPDIEIEAEKIVINYLNNRLTHAVVFQGLEPLDSLGDIDAFLNILRNKYQCQDDVVIYTGYEENEVVNTVNYLASKYSNITIKFGRYLVNQEPHYDEVLGVYLASDNQYAKKIS